MKAPTPFISTHARAMMAAFTLLEVLFVVALVALLAGSTLCFIHSRTDGCIDRRFDRDLENIRTQLQLYKAQNGSLPSTEQGLKALVERPGDASHPPHWRQVAREVPVDAWGTPYQFRFPATKSKQDGYDLFSCGKDKIAGTADDLGNW